MRHENGNRKIEKIREQEDGRQEKNVENQRIQGFPRVRATRRTAGEHRDAVCGNHDGTQCAAYDYGVLSVQCDAGGTALAGGFLRIADGGPAQAGNTDARVASADDSGGVPNRVALPIRRVDHRGGHVYQSLYDECFRGGRITGQPVACGFVRLYFVPAVAGIGRPVALHQGAAQRPVPAQIAPHGARHGVCRFAVHDICVGQGARFRN